MKCKWMRSRLQSYLEGTLSPNERKAADEHLQQCPQCQIELDEWQQVFAMLSSPENANINALPDDFTEKVMAAIRSRAPAPPRKPFWQRLYAQPVLASCVATFMFAVVLNPSLSEHLQMTAITTLYYKIGSGLSLAQALLARSILAFSDQLQEILCKLLLGGL